MFRRFGSSPGLVILMLIQPIKFIIIGIFNTFISFIVYCLCFTLLKFSYFWSLLPAYVFGIINSYIWNSKWTFNDNALNCRIFLKFTLVYVGTFFINLAILSVAIKIIKLDGLISQAIALTIAGVISFTGYKYWTFKRHLIRKKVQKR